MYVSMKAVGTWFFYDILNPCLFCKFCSVMHVRLAKPWEFLGARNNQQNWVFELWKSLFLKEIGETNSRLNMPVKNETLKNSDQIMCDRTIQKFFGTRDFILHKLENFCTPRWSNVVLMLLTKKDDKNGSLKIIHSRSLSCQDWVSDTQCHAMVIQVKLLCRMVIGQQDFCSVGII